MAKALWPIYLVALNVVGCLLPLSILVLPTCVDLQSHPSGWSSVMRCVLDALEATMPIVFYASLIAILYTALSGKRYHNLICASLAATAYPIWIIVNKTILYPSPSGIDYRDLCIAYVLSWIFLIAGLLILTPIRKKLHHFR